MRIVLRRTKPKFMYIRTDIRLFTLASVLKYIATNNGLSYARIINTFDEDVTTCTRRTNKTQPAMENDEERRRQREPSTTTTVLILSNEFQTLVRRFRAAMLRTKEDRTYQPEGLCLCLKIDDIFSPRNVCHSHPNNTIAQHREWSWSYDFGNENCASTNREDA